jgi:hypothetical protein
MKLKRGVKAHILSFVGPVKLRIVKHAGPTNVVMLYHETRTSHKSPTRWAQKNYVQRPELRQ